MGKRNRRRSGDPAPGEETENGAVPEVAVDPDAPEPGAPAGPAQPDARLREVALLVEEADYLLQLYRWIVLKGDVPKAQEWLKTEPWPHPDHVIDVFGSWEKFLAHAGIPGSPLLARLRAADSAQRDLAAREKAAQRDLARVEDLRRQVDTARRAREAAQEERTEQLARAERAERALQSAERRAAQAEDRLRARTEETAAAAPEAPDARVSALEDELTAVRAHREELLGQVEGLREDAERDRRAIGRLSALLADAGDGAAAPEAVADAGPPPTVLAALERAATQAEHLVFTDDARESAADSPYRRPAEILDALGKLDVLAGRYADPGGFGRSLTQAATELGLTYKGDVSELARSRNPHAYSATWDGHRLDLGPHVALGSGSGAGFIARIYLHVADGTGEVPRGLYVGHVGRHLPDTTT